MGGGGRERHDAHLRWSARHGRPGDSDNWPARRTRPDKRNGLLPGSWSGHARISQAVPDHHSAPGLGADPGPDGSFARGGEFARSLAFDVVLASGIEIAQIIAFRLTVAFAPGIPVPLVIHAAGDLRSACVKTA